MYVHVHVKKLRIRVHESMDLYVWYFLWVFVMTHDYHDYIKFKSSLEKYILKLLDI